jgi:hypothetical protein
VTTLLRRKTRPPQGPGHYSVDGSAWFDEGSDQWLRVKAEEDSLVIELEDLGATSWWAGILTTLGSQYGSTYSRFVGHAVSADPRWPTYTLAGPSFPRVRSLPDSLAPEEAWAPGTGAALAELRHRLEAEGWRLVGHGESPWAYRYVRPCVEWPPSRA